MSCTLRARVSPGLGVTQGLGSNGRSFQGGKSTGALRTLVTFAPPSLSPSRSLSLRLRPGPLLSLPPLPPGGRQRRGNSRGCASPAAEGTPADTPPAADPEPAPMPAEAPAPAKAPAPKAKGGGGGGGVVGVLLHPGVTLGLHVASAGLVALAFFNGSLFGYHPTLMAAAFLLLMPEALLSAIRGGVVSKLEKLATRKCAAGEHKGWAREESEPLQMIALVLPMRPDFSKQDLINLKLKKPLRAKNIFPLLLGASIAVYAMWTFDKPKQAAAAALLKLSKENHPTDYFASPVSGRIHVTGTCGELRPNHFHAGLDIDGVVGNVDTSQQQTRVCGGH